MARYSGRYYKGASKDVKALKRAEAEGRQLTYSRRDDPLPVSDTNAADW